MSFFGQVWLWSLAGFLVGAFLCWALVARPARRRVIELEDSLADARRTRATPAREPERPHDERPHDERPFADRAFDDRAFDDRAFDDRAFDDRDERSSYDMTALSGPTAQSGPAALSAPPEASPEPAEPPALAEVESTQLIDTPPVRRHPPVEAPPEVEPEWFPVAERFDVSQFDTDAGADRGREPEFDVSQLAERQHLIDDLPEDIADDRGEPARDRDDDDDRGPAGTIFTQHTTPISRTLINRLDSDESLVDDLADDDDGQAEPERALDQDRGRFAAALTPDDEEEYARQADESTAMTRYFPPVRPDTQAHDTHQGRDAQVHDTVAVPRLTGDPAASSPQPVEAAGHPVDDLADSADSPVEAARYPRQAADSPAEPAGPASLPKRTPGREVRRPVGESSAFTPTSRGLDMFTPASDATGSRTREPEPSAFTPQRAARPEPEPTVFAPSVAEPVEEAVADTPNGLLPKRVPKKPGDRFPFGVQTGQAPVASTGSAASAASPAEPDAPEPDRARSLFEPVVPADEAAAKAATPAPKQLRRGAPKASALPSGGVDTFVPPGPFGPGSAMPLPGGSSPSSEYRVKASVTALRYCSPESARFDRTVAEVWFRSVADAERVGFRPLG